MELKDIASVSGKPGLFRVVKPTRTGLILESLDGKSAKIVTGPNHRVSLLHEISIYTEDFDKTIPLEDVFRTIYKEFGDDPGVDSKSDADELKAFMEHIIPDYDKDKVYVSDMKKLVSWYALLTKVAPEIMEDKKESKEAESQPKDQPGKKEDESSQESSSKEDQT